MRFHETVVIKFSGAQTSPHSVGGQKNFTYFHVHIRYYISMATTTTIDIIGILGMVPD